jgi:hypothetical protein
MWSVSWVTPEASSAAGLYPIIPFPLHLSTPSRGVVWLALHCALYFTRPPQARQDAPLPERAHSDRARFGSTEYRPHLRPSEFAPSRHPQSDGRVVAAPAQSAEGVGHNLAMHTLAIYFHSKGEAATV